MLLTVTMATANALLYTLRIPRQVIVDDHGAELKIDAFRACLRGNHDAALLFEVLHQCGAGIGRARTTDTVSACMLCHPSGVNLLGASIVVGAVEQNDTRRVGRFGQQPKQVVLSTS